MNPGLNGLFKMLCVGVALFPVLAAAEPTTAPVQVTAAATPRLSPRVEVFPFLPISGATTPDWTGRGIQENLQSDVSHTGATLVMPAESPAPGEDDLAVARQNHADLAVTGSYQIVGDQIRANGRLIDVATNTSAGGFSATGSREDLFKVEDALGEQLRSLLPGPLTPSQIQQAFDQPQPDVIDQQPVYTAPPATVNNYYDTMPVTPYYAPDYGSYDDYPYNYGVYGGFGFISPGYGYGHYDRGHDFGGRGFTGTHFGASPAFRGNSGGGFHGNIGGGFHGGGFSGGGFSGGHAGGGHR